MRRGWIFVLLAAAAGGQEFSEADLDLAIREVEAGRREGPERIVSWGPKAGRAAPALVASWRQDEERVRPMPGFATAVAAAIWAIGPDAIPDLAKATKGKKRSPCLMPMLERFANEAPAAPLDPACEPKLFALLNDTEPSIRRAAAAGLATRGAAVVPRLVELLGDKSWRRREAAALALGRVDPPPEQVSGTLLTATRDENEAVRAEAVLAVGRLGSASQEVLGVLLVATADPRERVAAAAMSALEARGKEIAPRLIEAWDGSDAAALAASEVLARFGDAMLDQVVEAIGSGGPRRKRFGAAYLGRIGAEYDLSVIERTLMPLLGDPAPDVRAAAAEAFGIALPEVAGRALDTLLPAASDPDPRVRAAAVAAAARGAPDDPRVRAAVEKALTDAAPVVKATAKLLANAAASPATWSHALEESALPLAARMLAAERLRALGSGFAPVLPSLAKVVGDASQPTEVRAAAAFSLKLLLSRRIFEGRGDVDAATRPAVDRALAWLAKAQQTDGRWAAEAWNSHDLGVTGLAILAFLAAGHTHRDLTGKDPYADRVRDGLKFIVSTQQKDGLLIFGPRKQHTLVEHAIATQALCEAVAMTGDRNRRAAAQAAVAYCERARNPYLAWRYEVRGGENDTHVTSWMVSALRVADRAGFKVDPGAFEGARLWVDKMTEPNFGQVGYNYPGGAPFRAKDRNERFPPDASHAPTAAGIWMRMILGEDPTASEMVRKGADLCLEIPPTFDRPGYADFYYWYYGTLATFEAGGRHASKWETELRKVVLARQNPDGSWDPEDAWGFAGGRVYSTAILTLALLTPGRYPRGWGSESGLQQPYYLAEAALQEAAQSPSPRVRAAALGERPK